MSSSQQNQLLALADIITPQGVSWWPLAMGWWISIVIIFITTLVLLATYRRHQKKWGYRREALTLLRRYKRDSKATDTAVRYLECLKRSAISAYPNSDVDALYGKAWLHFLNRQTPKPLFGEELEKFICTSQYQKTYVFKDDNLYLAVEAWIKQHSVHYPNKVYPSTQGPTT
jgi:hypothetical protein